MRRTWRADIRRDVTLSLPDEDASRRASQAVRRALADSGYGYTLTRGVGAWDGRAEDAYTFALAGNTAAWIVAVDAAHEAGCTAVQVETWGLSSAAPYECTEWRPDHV